MTSVDSKTVPHVTGTKHGILKSIIAFSRPEMNSQICRFRLCSLVGSLITRIGSFDSFFRSDDPTSDHGSLLITNTCFVDESIQSHSWSVSLSGPKTDVLLGVTLWLCLVVKVEIPLGLGDVFRILFLFGPNPRGSLPSPKSLWNKKEGTIHNKEEQNVSLGVGSNDRCSEATGLVDLSTPAADGGI